MTDVQGETGLDPEAALQAATMLLSQLRDGHRRLEDRAERVEAELCRTNEELARKVEELDLVGRRLEAVLRNTPTGVVVYDENGRLTRVNAAAADLLGLREHELEGAVDAAGLRGASANGERTRVACADGRERVLVHKYAPVALTDGTPVGAVETIDDQTELDNAEARMRRLGRAAALGTMVGGVAHEVRKPLHAIGGFAELLEREAEPNSRAAQHAARIRRGVADLEEIVASMLGVAGRGELQREDSEVLPILEAAIEAGVPLDENGPDPRWLIDLACDTSNAKIDPVEARQAVRNLVANACHAQPKGGAVRVHATVDEGALVVTVDDAGPGVPADVRERLFDPFFTTRAEGTGLGLAVVLRIAELHGGGLELQDEPSPLGGARFLLRLPTEVADDSPSTPSHPTR